MQWGKLSYFDYKLNIYNSLGIFYVQKHIL